MGHVLHAPRVARVAALQLHEAPRRRRPRARPEGRQHGVQRDPAGRQELWRGRVREVQLAWRRPRRRRRRWSGRLVVVVAAAGRRGRQGGGGGCARGDEPRRRGARRVLVPPCRGERAPRGGEGARQRRRDRGRRPLLQHVRLRVHPSPSLSFWRGRLATDPLPLRTSPHPAAPHRTALSCPCLRCTVKIVQCGVKEVIYSLSYSMDAASRRVMEEAGVVLRQMPQPPFPR